MYKLFEYMFCSFKLMLICRSVVLAVDDSFFDDVCILIHKYNSVHKNTSQVQ